MVLFIGFAIMMTGCGGGNSPIATNDSTSTSSGGIGNTGGGSGTNTGTITVKWVAPSTRVDNTAVSLSDIRGYRLYYGSTATSTPNYININNGGTSEYQVTLPIGSYYFRISAIDSNGYEGQISPATKKTI